jgi:hypothetical protein
MIKRWCQSRLGGCEDEDEESFAEMSRDDRLSRNLCDRGGTVGLSWLNAMKRDEAAKFIRLSWLSKRHRY